MPLYKGKVFKQFLVDRYAMGFDFKAISEEFERLMGLHVSEAEIEKILEGSDADVKLREEELLQELLSQNTFSSLYNIKSQLDEVRQQAKDARDFKTYAQLTNTAIHNVEVLIGMTEKFKERQGQQKAIGTQNNILVLQYLEKDGALKIIDVDKVKRLLEAGDTS